ncbi:MAG: tetratricopeptide repeat protein [Candidatus Zixiibacteriota bacterium]|jgi:tetratricopeptide (TPR) repeat protein
MRKSLHLPGALILCALLITVACSTNEAMKYRYQTEKKYTQAERMAADLEIKPELTTPDQVRQLRIAYAEAADQAFEGLRNVDSSLYQTEFRELSTLAFRSTMRVCQLFFADRKYDTCVTLIDHLMQTAVLSRGELMTATVQYGQALQATGQWDSALATYNYAIETYYPPVDDQGGVVQNLFDLPVLKYQIASMTRDSAMAVKFANQAEDYYRRIANEYPKSNMATGAHANLARLYYDTRKWRQSIAELRQLTDTTDQTILDARLRVADIYAVHLDKPDTALTLYEDIYTDLTGRDTIFRPLILFKESLAQMQKKQYEAARRTLVDLQDRYPGYYLANAQAQYLKARSFDLEGNWQRAETEYKYLIEQYDGSVQAMSTHLYLARKLEEMGRADESKLWYQRAEDYFDEVASRGSGTELEGKALMFKAELYRELKQWPQAAETLTEIYTKFPRTDVGRKAIVTAAQVYRDRLKQPATADSLIAAAKAAITKPEPEPDWEETQP